MPLILYRSAQLLVKAAHRGSECCVVTFDSFTDNVDLDRPAFGEEFLARHGISAVHVVNARNHWYHEPDWWEAVSAARAAASGHARILSYGSSMGGYAALRFADHVGATSALAFSPQYSIDPRKAPFERRWPEFRRRKWLPELSGPLSSGISAVVVYDPVMEAERLHTERIAAEMSVRKLALPHAGHQTAAFLAECGLLSDIALQMVAGWPDLAGIGSQARARRKQSPHYLIALSACAERMKRSATAEVLVRRAIAIAPGAAAGWDRLGHLLSRLKRHDEAVETFRRLVELLPDVAAARLRLAKAQCAAGDHGGALETLRSLAGRAMTRERRRDIRMLTLEVQVRRLAARLRRASPV